MMAVSTNPQVWTLIDCQPATEQAVGAMYVNGFGWVIRTGDELTRVYQMVGRRIVRIK